MSRWSKEYWHNSCSLNILMHVSHYLTCLLLSDGKLTLASTKRRLFSHNALNTAQLDWSLMLTDLLLLIGVWPVVWSRRWLFHLQPLDFSLQQPCYNNKSKWRSCLLQLSKWSLRWDKVSGFRWRLLDAVPFVLEKRKELFHHVWKFWPPNVKGPFLKINEPLSRDTSLSSTSLKKVI